MNCCMNYTVGGDLRYVGGRVIGILLLRKNSWAKIYSRVILFAGFLKNSLSTKFLAVSETDRSAGQSY